MLPYFRRGEDNERGADAFHGVGGPLSVIDQRWPNPVSVSFVEEAASLGLPISDDFNGAWQEGAGMYQVTQKRGERWTSVRAYLDPHPNLEICTDCIVGRVLIEGGRAVGIVYSRGGERIQVRAGGGAVLSGGAFATPQLLMLSGIGPGDHLRGQGIEVLADRHGVGGNLHDLVDLTTMWRTESRTPFGRSVAGLARMALGLVRIVSHGRRDDHALFGGWRVLAQSQ